MVDNMNMFKIYSKDDYESMMHMLDYIYENSIDGCIPSIRQMMKKTNLGQSVIVALKNKMVKNGVISKCVRGGTKGEANNRNKILVGKEQAIKLMKNKEIVFRNENMFSINNNNGTNKKDDVCGNIYETNDYDKFKFLLWNRPVDRKHVERLKESIKKNIYLEPISVSKDFIILDGQHRFTAYKELGMAFKYIIETSTDKHSNIVITKNTLLEKWKIIDYISAYAKDGYEHYKTILKFMDEFKEFRILRMHINLLQDSCRWAGKDRKEYYLLEGGFKVKDIAKSRETASKLLSLRMKKAMTINGLDLCKNYKIFQALFWLIKIDGYNHDLMLEKLERYPTLLHPCINTQEYKNMLIYFYNYNVRSASKKIKVS